MAFSAASRRKLFFGGGVHPAFGRMLFAHPATGGIPFSFFRLGLKFGFRILFKKSSDFVQKAPHFKNFSF